MDARKIFVSSYQPLHLHSSHSNLIVPGARNVSQPWAGLTAQLCMVVFYTTY